MTSVNRTTADTDALMPKRLNPTAQMEAEDREDEALFDARMADVNAGPEMQLPAEVGDRVLQGDPLLVAICAWRGMTPAHLAQAAKLTQDEVARLESGQALEEHAARRVAEALQVDPMWIAGA